MRHERVPSFMPVESTIYYFGSTTLRSEMIKGTMRARRHPRCTFFLKFSSRSPHSDPQTFRYICRQLRDCQVTGKSSSRSPLPKRKIFLRSCICGELSRNNDIALLDAGYIEAISPLVTPPTRRYGFRPKTPKSLNCWRHCPLGIWKNEPSPQTHKIPEVSFHRNHDCRATAVVIKGR